jgi:hypothetical protein
MNILVTIDRWLGGFRTPRVHAWDFAGVLPKPTMHIPMPVGAKPPLDPLDTPLPCDVRCGSVTFRKGVPLVELVDAANRWHQAALGVAPIKQISNEDFERRIANARQP